MTGWMPERIYMRAAVASSDGIVVNQHFGRADTFFIYDITKDSGIKFVEKRRGRPFCHSGEHDDQELLDSIRLLEDCSKVFVLQLGRGAKEELIKCSIEPVVACGIIDEVLQAYK